MKHTTTDTVRYFFDNKKRSGVGDVYFVHRLNKTECEVFFMSDEVIGDLKEKSFRIDKTSVKIIEKGPVFNDRISVENIHYLTTKDGLKLFFKAHTGKDVHIIGFDKSNGKATLEFEHSPDFTAVDIACTENALDDSYLKIKPLKVSRTIVVTGYNQNYYDDLLFYFDNTKRSGGEDVEEVKKIDDETHLVMFMSSHCVIDVCKRKHSLNDKELKVDVYYQRVNSGDENNMFTKCDRSPLNEPGNQDYERNNALTKKRKRSRDDTLAIQNCLPCDCSLKLMKNKSKPAFKNLERSKFIELAPTSMKITRDIERTSLSPEVTPLSNEDPSFVCKVEGPKELDNFESESKKHLSDQHDNEGINLTSLASNITKHSNKVPLSVNQVEVTKQAQKLNWMNYDEYQHDVTGAQAALCFEKTEAKRIGIIHKTESEYYACHCHLPFLTVYQEFDVPSGPIKREIRDCTAMPGVGWMFSDFNNSELIRIDRKHGISIYEKMSKPMFVTCIAGDVAVSVVNGRKITVFDKNTWTVKTEIPTKDSVLGITNIRKRLLFRAANIGCRFIASNQSDTLVPIKGDNMPYIAVWKNLIFLTNWKAHEIYCYNTSGEIQWTFSNENLRCPNGVSTDKEGNVFIVGTYSHNILIVSNNYKETKEYRFKDAGMKYPIAIDYDKSSCKFIVCNLKGKVKIFDVVAAGKYTNG